MTSAENQGNPNANGDKAKTTIQPEKANNKITGIINNSQK